MLSRQFIVISLALLALPSSFPAVALSQESLGTPTMFLAQASDGTLTEEAVQKLVEQVISAGKNRDINGLLSYFTPFTYSEFTVNSGISSETIRLTGLDEHRAFFQEFWKDVQASEDIDNYVQISLSSDEKTAFVTRTRLLNLKMKDGKRVLVSSKSEARITTVDGQLKVISIREVADSDVRP